MHPISGTIQLPQTIGVIGIVLGVTLMFYLKKNFGPRIGQKQSMLENR